jgi:hypothetical protein
MGSLRERGHLTRRDWAMYALVVALTISASVAVAFLF